MSRLEVFGAASKVVTKLEDALRTIHRLRLDCDALKDLVEVLANNEAEIESILEIVMLIEEEDALLTAGVCSRLDDLETVASSLITSLRAIEKRWDSLGQYIFQFTSGSKFEDELADLRADLNRAKRSLAMCLQYAQVGLSKTAKDGIAMDHELVSRIDRLLQNTLGKSHGLKIAKDLREGNDISESLPKSTVSISSDAKYAPYGAHFPFTSRPAGQESSSLIIDHMTLDQASQMHGPTGVQDWKKSRNIKTRSAKSAGDIAAPVSSAINRDPFAHLAKNRATLLSRRIIVRFSVVMIMAVFGVSSLALEVI